jgi:eukaryotic-like serine/threonine-protein kinase
MAKDMKKRIAIAFIGTLVSGSIAYAAWVYGSPSKSLPVTNSQFSELVDSKDVQMVLVPKGEFTMGSDKGSSDQRPAHQVFLDSYYIDKFEVTNALYKRCIEVAVCDPPTNTTYYYNSQYAQHPVVYMNWDMAKEYCEWRDALLPTEAEWEKAARGEDGRTLPWGEGFSANYSNYGLIIGDTKPVGSYPDGISPYGAYDMAGNVSEWVADWYDGYPGNTEVNSNYGTTYRVLRGGSWNDYGGILRSAFRQGFYPTASYDFIGFRCAKAIP